MMTEFVFFGSGPFLRMLFVHSVTLLMNSSLDLQGAGVLLPCSSGPPERFGSPADPAWLWCLNVQRTPVRARLWEVSTASHSHWSWAGCAHDPSVTVSLPVRWNNTTTNNFIKHSLSHEIHTMMYRERTNSSPLTKMLAQHSANFITGNETAMNVWHPTDYTRCPKSMINYWNNYIWHNALTTSRV